MKAKLMNRTFCLPTFRFCNGCSFIKEIKEQQQLIKR